jgi:predicted nucleic acid-binding protein
MPEKKWFFDAVVLSNFLFADAVTLLKERYRNKGIITREVYDEISAGFAEYPELKNVEKLLDDKSFRLVSLSKRARKFYLELILHLGKGESACIALARVTSGVVVTDDRAARLQCRNMNIPVTGTVGILKAAILSGQTNLTRADAYLKTMIKAGFYAPVRSLSEII